MPEFKIGDEVEGLGIGSGLPRRGRVVFVGTQSLDVRKSEGDHVQTIDRVSAKLIEPSSDAVEHPNHYGGKDNVYEAIKVIEAWELGFNLGNAVKYISRAGKKGDRLEDLKKAKWYLEREIKNG